MIVQVNNYVPPSQPEATVTLTLKLSEAKALNAIIGNSSKLSRDRFSIGFGDLGTDIYRTLTEAFKAVGVPTN